MMNIFFIENPEIPQAERTFLFSTNTPKLCMLCCMHSSNKGCTARNSTYGGGKLVEVRDYKSLNNSGF